MALTHNQLAEYQHWQQAETRVINGKPVRFRDVCVRTLEIPDVEDPDLFVADLIRDWQQTDAGKFVMENAVDPPYWISAKEPVTYRTCVKIMARLSEQNETFWRLKWG